MADIDEIFKSLAQQQNFLAEAEKKLEEEKVKQKQRQAEVQQQKERYAAGRDISFPLPGPRPAVSGHSIPLAYRPLASDEAHRRAEASAQHEKFLRDAELERDARRKAQEAARKLHLDPLDVSSAEAKQRDSDDRLWEARIYPATHVALPVHADR